MVFSGTSPEKNLMEIMELPTEQHPFFLGVQFHPEFHARPLSPAFHRVHQNRGHGPKEKRKSRISFVILL